MPANSVSGRSARPMPGASPRKPRDCFSPEPESRYGPTSLPPVGFKVKNPTDSIRVPA